MNSHQQMQRVSELRMRRWGRSEATATASASLSSSELELSLRSSSLNTSFSTSETICETATTSSPSTRERRSYNTISRTASTAGSDSPVNFEFCRAGSGTSQSVYHGGGSSRAASPLLNGSSPCPSPTSRSPRSPMTPRSPRSPRSPCRSPSSQQPSPGHQTPPSASPHRYSSRRRSGVQIGNLARLASRRSSRDSEAGEPSPLQCVRNTQRRTSNFLEIPGEFL